MESNERTCRENYDTGLSESRWRWRGPSSGDRDGRKVNHVYIKIYEVICRNRKGNITKGPRNNEGLSPPV